MKQNTDHRMQIVLIVRVRKIVTPESVLASFWSPKLQFLRGKIFAIA